MLHICLVEDSTKLWSMIHEEIIDQWFTCDWYTCVEDIHMNFLQRYHIFILDVMLPGKDWYSFAHEIREICNAGIIFLTAKSSIDHKEEWFDAWADDYITKPFHTKELIMRIDALSERLEPTHFVQLDNVCIDITNRMAKKDNTLVHLTPIEREVLSCLIRNNWSVCRRADLIEKVRWTDQVYGMHRSLDVSVAHIRKKLWKHCIETVPSVWYKLWKRSN